MKAAVIQTRPIEGPWELPEGWRWEPLGAVVTQSSGKLRPDPTSDLPFVGLDSVEPNSTTLAATVPFSTMRSAANSFSRGEVLYGRLRPYLNKVWLADRAGACSGEFIVLQPRADLEAEYLKWLLHHGGFVRFASHAVTGDRPRIDLAKMSGYPVPLPPPDTQRRIVARIDELFSELDDGEAALARARADLETYRKSLLKAAVTGELTADWRAANPAAETGDQLLQRILAERKARWAADPNRKGKTYKEPILPVRSLENLPDSWSFGSLDQITSKIVDGTHHTPTYIENGVPFLSVKDVRNGELHFEDCKFISEEEHTALRRRCNPERGDLLVTKSGTIGRTAVVETDQEFSLFVSVALLKPALAELSGHWLEFAFHHWFRTADVAQDVKGTAIKNLHLEDFRELIVPLPPLDEQVEIRRRYRVEMDKLPVELMSSSRANLAKLRQSILAAAFRGELVQ